MFCLCVTLFSWGDSEEIDQSVFDELVHLYSGKVAELLKYTSHLPTGFCAVESFRVVGNKRKRPLRHYTAKLLEASGSAWHG